MIENQHKIVEEVFENLSKKSQCVLKDFANYFFKHYMVYLGRKNGFVFFGDKNIYEQISKIVFQQQFTLCGQMRIIKKWNVKFENVTCMNKSNYWIALTAFEIQLWKIDNFYNFSIVKTILKFENENFCFTDRMLTFKSLLLLNENDDLIVLSISTTIYVLIQEERENWKLQQKIQIGSFYNTFIIGYQLNDQGNILILKYNQRLQWETQQKLLVILKVDDLWKIIKEINLKYESNQSYSFFGREKFILLNNDCKQENLSIWQIFTETQEVQLIHKQKLEILDRPIQLRFKKQRDFLIAYQPQSLLLIKCNNNKFHIYQNIRAKDLELADITNEGLLILQPAIVRPTPCDRIQVQKLY